MGEIAYMKAQKAIMINSIPRVEEENFVNNRGYVFRPNNNLLMHSHPGLRNHENLSYGSQEIVSHVPHQLSASNALPSFQGQGDSSLNNQGQRRQPSFEESVLNLHNDMKKKNGNQIVNLEINQANMGVSLKKFEIQVGELAHHFTEWKRA